MAQISVNWGRTPDVSAGAQSLGQAIAGAAAGPSPLQQLKIDGMRLHNEEMLRRQALIDQQIELAKAKVAGESLANDNVTKMRSLAHDAAVAEGEAAVNRIPHPPFVLNANDPAIVEYNQSFPINAAAERAKALYTYGVGDGTPAQRADAVNTFTGGNLVQYGDADQARRGAALTGHNPGMSDYFGTGDLAPFVKARADAAAEGAKPHFFDNGRVMNTRDPVTGDWHQTEVQGAQLSDDQFMVDYINRRNRNIGTSAEDDIRFRLLNEKQYPTTFKEFTDQNRVQHQVPISRAPYSFPAPGAPPSSDPLPVQSPVFSAPGGDMPPIVRSASPAIVGQESAPPAQATRGAPTPSQDALPPGTITLGRGVVNPPTRDQGVAAKLSVRASNAEQVLSQVKVPEDAPSLIQNLINATSESERIGMLQNYMRDPRYSTFFTAASSFVTSVLRDESGAAIGKSEFWRMANEMLPYPTDNPETIAFKKSQRAASIYGMLNEAYGKGSPEYAAAEQRLTAAGITPDSQFYTAPAQGGAPRLDVGGEATVNMPNGPVRIRRKN